MANADDFKRIAVALDGTQVNPHMSRLSFKVNRIYATLAEDGLTANLKFLPDEQELKCLTHSDAFQPVSGGWGKQGWTSMTLSELSENELKSALEMAWAHAVPKKSVR